MPIYEFACKKCDQQFEELVFNKAEVIRCPKCRGKRVKRLMSVAAIKTSSGFKAATKSGGEGGCGGSCGSSCGGHGGHCGHCH